MSKMTDIQNKVNEAMDSVQNIERAAPKPFFYTRLEARLLRDERNVWEMLSRVITRPGIAILTISLVLILNVFVAVRESDPLEDQPDYSGIASTEDLRTTSFYDIENVQP